MENQYFTAVLIDTVSIQQYIFSSNKLKENIGASYIIEHLVYKQYIPQAIENAFSISGFDIDEWMKKPDSYKLPEDSNSILEVGYIGGGNGMLIFRDNESTKTFIREYTKLLLQNFPGLRTAFGMYNNFKYEGDDFQKARGELNKDIQLNKALAFRQVTAPKPGIVTDCPLSNEAQETRWGAFEYEISMVSSAKLNVLNEAQEELFKTHQDALGNDFAFTSELDQLGQPEDKGYIAIVHIDGNSMGQRFNETTSLDELRRLSIEVSSRADDTMKEFIKDVADLFRKDRALFNSDSFQLKKFVAGKNATRQELNWEKEERRALPIRPLISAGDDITFICEGRLGVFLAELFIKKFTSGDIGDSPFHACAGVAIVKTKYPFYRAYNLAEELTHKAKEASREKDGSYLQFMISASGFSGTLDKIIEQQFSTKYGSLPYGPYHLDKINGDSKSIIHLLNGIMEFNKNWPRNKKMKLRDVLRQDKADQDYFLAEMEARKLKLPAISGRNFHGHIWCEKADKKYEYETPYYDMIVLSDFYPRELLNNIDVDDKSKGTQEL